MTAEPIAFQTVLDEDGHIRVPDDAAARLGEQLGHAPRPGEALEVIVKPARRKPFRSSYGILAHRREALENVDIAAVRREMTEQLRRAGKI